MDCADKFDELFVELVPTQQFFDPMDVVEPFWFDLQRSQYVYPCDECGALTRWIYWQDSSIRSHCCSGTCLGKTVESTLVLTDELPVIDTEPHHESVF